MRKYIGNAINPDAFMEIAKIKGLDLSSYTDDCGRYLNHDKKVEVYEFVMSFFNSEDSVYDFTDEYEMMQGRTEEEIIWLLSKKLG